MKLKDTNLTEQDIINKVNEYMIETGERFDFVAETAKGMYIYGADNSAYLDFYAGIAVNSVGNCNEKVVNAVKDQCTDLMQTFNYPYTIPQALLAEKICTTIGMDKIFYQNTGTEANEAMIKMARKYGVEKYGSHKFKIITAAKSFHGRTFGAMSATGQPNTPCQIGFGDLTPGFAYGEYNNLDSFKALVDEDTIGIMLEPVQGEGGVYPATREFMQGIRQLCDDRGLLLLLDEVQTGWCRTGAIMGYMNYGIKPDIVSMAKALGGGMPIGAVCAAKEVAKAFSLGSHGTTFGGHPVSCAAALAAIDELLTLKCAENAKQTGDYFSSQLEHISHVKEIRHLGLLIGVEFNEYVNSNKVKHKCFDNHLLVTSLGEHVIRMVPPLIVEKKQCDIACEIISHAVEELYGS